jgi:hypothetical protein
MNNCVKALEIIITNESQKHQQINLLVQQQQQQMLVNQQVEERVTDKSPPSPYT